MEVRTSGRPDTRDVALRVLVLATGPDDVQLPAWQRVLDRLGTPYDVVLAGSEGLDEQRLVRPDGVGRYCAVLLTSSGLLVADDGGFVPALDAAGWESLWRYESAYGVRQVSLNAAPSTTPEDLGLRPVAEGPTGAGTRHLRLTAAGADVFGHLRPDALVPLSDAYVYRSRLDPAARARALLTLDGDVVAALSTAPDGRERLAVCFTVGAAQPVEEVLGHGLVRWACRGVLLGEQRHWLTVDVDDWCDLGDGGARTDGPRPPDAGATTEALVRAQTALRARHPLAPDLAFTLAYNAGGAPRWAVPAAALPAAPVEAAASAAVGQVHWVNHTMNHRWLERTDLATTQAQIADNLRAAQAAGITVEPGVLKTPGYSGLGVLVEGEDVPDGVVVDRGLGASNPALLEAARRTGVRWLHGNMSFPSHRPACFNGGLVHPLAPDLFVVPDWPTALAWWAATPDDVVDGHVVAPSAARARPVAPRPRDGHGRHQAPAAPDGTTPAPVPAPSPVTVLATVRTDAGSYAEVLAAEAEVAYRHVVSGSVYTHTLHRANTWEYAPGRSVAVDWLDAVLERYEALHAVPLLSPRWSDLAGHVAARTRHTAALAAGADAVLDRGAGTVRLTSPVPASLFVTGAAPAGPAPGAASTRYGRDLVTRVDVAAGDVVLLAVEAS